MNSVGAILRTERERQKREVAEIAEELCITQRYLRAIEQDDLKSLPGTFFYKSFVRQYAAIVGVDASSLQPGIEALTAPVEPVPLSGADPNHMGYSPMAVDNALNRKPIRDLDPIVRDGNRNYFQDSRIGLSVAALVAMLLACSGIYAWYNKAPKAPVAITITPQAIAQPLPQRVVEPLITAVKAETPEPTVNVTTTTGPDGVNHVVLNLEATEKTWISIVCDGKQIFSGVLQPSQTKTLTGVEVAKMKVGNAGGLDVRWNGKAIGPIGPRGQVRVLLFTPENFQILQPSSAM